ncbi:MAG: histidinol-phosphate transaminase [Anaerolinea sp.]|nr:histidinol-phosphate transaminase [Anaerolinea sp.]
MNPRRFFRPDFDDLEAYTPVKPLDVLAAEIGLPIGQLVKLDANENLYGAHPAVVEAAAKADHHIYPDPGQTSLRAAIAEYVGVTPGQVVAGSGADDLIDVILRLARPAIAVTASPTFGMYSFLAKVNGTRFVEVPRLAGFQVDVRGLASTVERGAHLIFLTSPNNPTGNCLTRAELEAICNLEALVVVDEAYIEFGGESAVPLIAAHPNLIVIRTFSKWAGLAGLRVGYSVSEPGIAAALMAIKQPYNVNVAGDLAAQAALRHRAEVFETVKCIVAERERLARDVGALGWLRPLPSEANFVLFAVTEGHDAARVAAELRRRGVLIRYYNRPDLANYVRISAGRPEDTGRLLAALREVEPLTRREDS